MNDTNKSKKNEGIFDGLEHPHYERMGIQENNDQNQLLSFSKNSGGHNLFNSYRKTETAIKSETAI
jgi:hypothetical protein